ncbi:metallopeptidase family protein [Methylorubrum salsuginis]|uniref:Predicted Zn-dependent protease, minimal metalloprotease (MMP)-like domain n=1 Tax=Methylorubrum salsuginis TaxID=414703 RepID=A0A1I4A225_9HYPH|nr:metallopeptidase family protein [Methylorubrum salsuginis]SFK50395.1 Predicted Zn-dependent protease, minimal metalloprotease (MMP)-like domain [Methylorubrum salsuginis]
MSATADWADLRAPSLAEIEALADAAFAALPEEFRRLCHGIRIHVDDFPDEETLTEMECESEFDLLGLFRGVGLAQSGEVATGQMPNAVWLYRRPLLDYWAEHDESLGHLVTHVLVHEIGHHFGLSDDDMAGIEAAADEIGGDPGEA